MVISSLLYIPLIKKYNKTIYSPDSWRSYSQLLRIRVRNLGLILSCVLFMYLIQLQMELINFFITFFR